MSFILDALRKSDQQRQGSVAPTLLTMQPGAQEAKRRPRWMHGAMAAALLGIGLLAGGLWQPTPPPMPQPAPQPASIPVATAAPATTPPTPAMQARKVMPNEPAVQTTTPRETRTSDQPPAAPATVAKTQTVGSSPPPHPHAAVVPASVAAEQGAPALAELPPALQGEILKMTISAHAYSTKPKASFVFVNDRMLREEEALAPGLKLERITPDGMIFSYKGYRFRRGVQ